MNPATFNRSSTMPRPRGRLFVALAVVIGVGLVSRLTPALRPLPGSKEVGDTLWATMLFLGLALFRPRSSTATLAAAAVAITFAIEFLKLVHVAWLDALRARPVTGLLLGHTFYWHDLLSYLLGVAIAVALDRFRLAAPLAERDSAAALRKRSR